MTNEFLMVKIRLRRMGTKGRPFYRVVVAHSTSGRNSSFVEAIGTYDPQSKPKHVKIDEERALHWLTMGAQPTETTAYLLNKIGVLDRYFELRPVAKKQYAFLDKRTSAMSVQSAIEPAASSKKAKAASEEPAAGELGADPVAVAEESAREPEAAPEAASEESAAAPQMEEPATEAVAEEPVQEVASESGPEEPPAPEPEAEPAPAEEERAE